MDTPLGDRAATAARDESLDRLIERHAAAVRRVAALYARDGAALEDLLQDVWLAVWRAMSRFRGDSSERTFVLRIAHHRGVTHSVRTKRPLPAELDALDALPDPAPEPDERLAVEQDRARLLAAVRRLPLGLREVVGLRLEGLSDGEIASVVGISPVNVAVRLTRARQALRRLLAAEDRT
jgi:RNA polymerase sigma factor (sigma-70 family)